MSTASTEGAGSPEDGRTRASDAEREEFARTVRDAIGEGRLTLEEGDERLAAVYAARYRDELGPLVADLPRERPGAGEGRRPPRPPRPGPMGGDDGGPGFRRRRPGFPLVLVLAAVILGIWALNGGFFWPLIPLIFLAVLLLRRGCGYRPRYRRW